MRVIRLHAHIPSIVTVEEFEDIKRTIEGRAFAMCPEPGDRILARLLHDNLGVYQWAKSKPEENTDT